MCLTSPFCCNLGVVAILQVFVLTLVVVVNVVVVVCLGGDWGAGCIVNLFPMRDRTDWILS